jgi:hypothetical protein
MKNNEVVISPSQNNKKIVILSEAKDLCIPAAESECISLSLQLKMTAQTFELESRMPF